MKLSSLHGASLVVLAAALLMMARRSWTRHGDAAVMTAPDGRPVEGLPGSWLGGGQYHVPVVGDTLSFRASPYRFLLSQVQRLGDVSAAQLYFTATAVLSGPRGLDAFNDPSLVRRCVARPARGPLRVAPCRSPRPLRLHSP
jgi:hypothetical protein